MFQKTFDAFHACEGGEAAGVGRIHMVVFQRVGGKGNAVEALFPFVVKQDNVFAAKMGVEDVRHVDVVMQKGFRAFAAEKQIGVFVEKAAHQIGGKAVVAKQGRGVFDGVEQKNAQIGGRALDEINVVTEFHLGTGGIDGRGGVGFAAVVQRHGDVADNGFHIIERPFAMRGSVAGHVFNHQRAARLEVMAAEIFLADVVNHIDWGEFEAHGGLSDLMQRG